MAILFIFLSIFSRILLNTAHFQELYASISKQFCSCETNSTFQSFKESHFGHKSLILEM